MVKIVTQLGKSRKYANGTVHENASGKFQILDRFLDDGIVMLKYEWLTGDKAGQIENNKEENINASIHKYQASRGLLGEIPENREVVTLRDIFEAISDLKENLNDNKSELTQTLQENNRILKLYEDDKQNIQRNLALMEDKLHAQTNLIADIAKHLNTYRQTLDEMTKGNLNRDEMIKEIGMMVDKNTHMIETITNQNDIFQNQQKMMDKLLEKI